MLAIREAISSPAEGPQLGNPQQPSEPLIGAGVLAAGMVSRFPDSRWFGISGANIETLLFQPEIGAKVVLTRHETSAPLAALSFSKHSGKVGICFSTSGAGALQLLTGLAEIRAENHPVIAFVGLPPMELSGQNVFQEASGIGSKFSLEQIFRTVLPDTTHLVSHPNEIPCLLETLSSALASRRRPHAVLISSSALNGDWRSGAKIQHPTTYLELWIGPECVASELAKPLRLLAKTLGGLPHRACFSPEALSLRSIFRNARGRSILGAFSHRSRSCAPPSQLLILGTSLTQLEQWGSQEILHELRASGRVDHFSLRPPALGATRSVWQPLSPESLAKIEIAAPVAETRESHERHAADKRRSAFSAPRSGSSPDETAASRNPDLALDAIAQLLERIPLAIRARSELVVDAGNIAIPALHFAEANHVRGCHIPLEMGGMGAAFGTALGLALAPESTRVILVTGDGSALMLGSEIHTFVHNRVPVLVVLGDNQGHSMCMAREKLYGPSFDLQNSFNHFSGLDFAAGYSRLFGIRAREIASRAELHSFDFMTEPALADFRAGAGPALIVLRLRPGEIPVFKPFRSNPALKRRSS